MVRLRAMPSKKKPVSKAPTLPSAPPKKASSEVTRNDFRDSFMAEWKEVEALMENFQVVKDHIAKHGEGIDATFTIASIIKDLELRWPEGKKSISKMRRLAKDRLGSILKKV